MQNPLTHNPFKGMPKWGIYATIGGGSLIGGYALWKHHQDTGSWSPFATTPASATGSDGTGDAVSGNGTVTDPVTGDIYSATQLDPNTGLTYAGEISQYGDVATAESAVTQFGTSTNAGDVYDTGYTAQTATDNLTVASAQQVYTSNSAWGQAVQAGLASVGYDPVAVATAVGDFLTQTPMPPSEVTIINAAIAEYGAPPVGNLQVIPQAVKQPSPTPAAPSKPTQPYPAPTGLSVKKTSGYHRQLSWNLIKGTSATGPTPTSYTVAVDRVGDGKSIVDTTVSTPDTASGRGQMDFTIDPLPKGWKSAKYRVRVWANGTTGIGPKSASITFTQT